MAKRERWASRIGVILAMAGNAVGLGNFLRFPVQAAQNGGGAFMIPYFTALILFGIPLAWCEWAMGRLGGAFRHGSSPGVLSLLWKHPAAKYIGALGVCLPLGVLVYYLYIESWTLAYAFFSPMWEVIGRVSVPELKEFLAAYQGQGSRFGVSAMAYLFFLLTIGVNYWVMSGGIAKGIERLARIGMPALLILAVILTVRVLSLGAPDPARPDHSVLNGLGFVWNPDLASLKDARVWLSAAGQVFFTLSVGFGAIQCYASYLRRRDDIVVTGLASSMTNEFVEIILGASIAIPAAVVFFGPAGTVEIARSGAFNLGFVTMPAIFQQMGGGVLFGFFWFFLLFVAGLTSSVALAQPAIAFFEDELGWSHRRALRTVWGFLAIAGHIPMLGLTAGALDELDFWAGTVGLALFAFAEIVVFFWIFGADKAWAEIHVGAEERIPRVFFYIMKYVTPAALLIILAAWLWQQGADVALMRNVDPAHKPWRWAARLLLVGMIAATCVLIRRAWAPRREAPP